MDLARAAGEQDLPLEEHEPRLTSFLDRDVTLAASQLHSFLQSHVMMCCEVMVFRLSSDVCMPLLLIKVCLSVGPSVSLLSLK